jgi:hypothetical protein
MRADAGDFDHRAFGRKTCRTAGGFERVRGSAAGRLADGSAMLADEEDYRVAAGVIVHAGDEGIAALDPMNKTVIPQKFERAIDSDRCRPGPIPQLFNDFVGPEWFVAREQSFEHVPAHRRQPLRTRGAQRFGVGDGRAGAAAMIVVGRWKNCRRHRCHLVATETAQFYPLYRLGQYRENVT